jgi:hypothetical protein
MLNNVGRSGGWHDHLSISISKQTNDDISAGLLKLFLQMPSRDPIVIDITMTVNNDTPSQLPTQHPVHVQLDGTQTAPPHSPTSGLDCDLSVFKLYLSIRKASLSIDRLTSSFTSTRPFCPSFLKGPKTAFQPPGPSSKSSAAHSSSLAYSPMSIFAT